MCVLSPVHTGDEFGHCGQGFMLLLPCMRVAHSLLSVGYCGKRTRTIAQFCWLESRLIKANISDTCPVYHKLRPVGCTARLRPKDTIYLIDVGSFAAHSTLDGRSAGGHVTAGGRRQLHHPDRPRDEMKLRRRRAITLIHPRMRRQRNYIRSYSRLRDGLVA